jgi:hypothetical protein
MTKTAFYDRYKLVPDSGNVVTSWGAIQPSTGKYLFQCWDNEKKFVKMEDRTDEAIMIVKLLSPQDIQASPVGGNARARSVEAVRGGATAFVAVSTGTYPNWIGSANLAQVYPVLQVLEERGEISAKVGPPVPTNDAFAE